MPPRETATPKTHLTTPEGDLLPGLEARIERLEQGLAGIAALLGTNVRAQLVSEFDWLRPWVAAGFKLRDDRIFRRQDAAHRARELRLEAMPPVGDPIEVRPL